MTIREATLEDAEAVARIHVDAWRTSYAGIVPDSILAALSYDSRRRDWEKRVQVRETSVLVAERDGEVIAVGACGPNRSPLDGYAGEIYELYVDPQAQGEGAGTQLFAALCERLREGGMERQALWVYADHHQGCAFYEKLGGERIGERETEMAGRTIAEVAYGFTA